MSCGKERLWRGACGGLLFALACVMLATVADYGSSWDEDIRKQGGEEKLAYYIALFSGDFKAAAELGRKPDNYPGFHDLNLALIRRVSPLSDELTGHLFAALFGWLAIAGTMLLGRLVGGYRVAFWAGLLLVFTPTFYGYQFMNPKDIPFACGTVWSLAGLVQWIRAGRKPGWSTVVATGLAIGVTMATRVGGLVLFCYLGLFVVLAAVAEVRSKRTEHGAAVLTAWLRAQAPRVALAAAIGFVVLVVYWPASHWKLFGQTGSTLAAVTDYGWNQPVFFEGQFFKAKDLPGYYLPKMFLITTPLVFLLAFAVGLGNGARMLKRQWCRGRTTEAVAGALLPFAILFPLAYVWVKDSTVYNGVRHLLFILPPAAVVCGYGLCSLLGGLLRERPHWKMPCRVALALVFGLVGVTMVRLHPYQYIYYNELVGGVPGAAARYETDTWCTSYKELVAALKKELDAAYPQDTETRITLGTEHVTWLIEPYVEQTMPERNVRVLRSRPEADDFYLATTLWGADTYYHGDALATVERLGVRLAVVRDRRFLKPHERVLGYQPPAAGSEGGRP